MLYVVKEAIYCMSIRFFFKQEMQSELQSHNASYRRTLHDREVQQKHITQQLEYQEVQLRLQLQTEELMMTSLKESFQESFQESERQLSGHNR